MQTAYNDQDTAVSAPNKPQPTDSDYWYVTSKKSTSSIHHYKKNTMNITLYI